MRFLLNFAQTHAGTPSAVSSTPVQCPLLSRMSRVFCEQVSHYSCQRGLVPGIDQRGLMSLKICDTGLFDLEGTGHVW